MRELCLWIAACSIMAGCTKAEPVTTPQGLEVAAAEDEDAHPAKAPPVAPVSEPAAPESGPASGPEGGCLTVLSVTSDASVFEEAQLRGAVGSNFGGWRAETIDPDRHHPVEVVSRFRIADRPLLWFTPEYTEVVVDAAVLSQLMMVHVTSMGLESSRVGALTPAGRGKIGGRELAEFLIRADVIQTWIHMSSTLCLLSETDDERGYRAQFSGEHLYYTNEENRDTFGFVFEVGPDGAIVVTGAEYQPFSTLVSG